MHKNKDFIYTFEIFIQKYKEKYWAVKLSDNIWNLVNHNYYLLIKKNINNGKEQVSISPYDLDCTKLLLTMTSGKLSSFKNRCKKLEELGIKFVADSSDDGGFICFEEKDLDVVAQVFKIKKKVKRELTEGQRQELSERLSKMRENK